MDRNLEPCKFPPVSGSWLNLAILVDYTDFCGTWETILTTQKGKMFVELIMTHGHPFEHYLAVLLLILMYLRNLKMPLITHIKLGSRFVISEAMSNYLVVFVFQISH